MPALDNPVAEWRHAYQVLGVTSDASAHAIKSAYRALVKRWHPDRYPPNTRDHADASQMTVLINQAYSAVQHAPLRYAYSSRTQANAEGPDRPQQSSSGQYYRAPYQTAPRQPYPPEVHNLANDWINHPRMDRIEFCIRFVCGAILGTFWSFSLIFFLSDLRGPATTAFTIAIGLICLGLIVGCAFGAARQGDKFWHSKLGTWDPF
jgi:hypothetical protein